MPGYEAPVNLAYSRRNRSAACRIPMYSASPKAKRVEFRPPDPSANPYLAFAAMLMAGLDGVLNKIHPGDPLDKDIYDLSPEEMKAVPSMPGSLDEALACLEDDHAFLLKGDVFTEELIETFIDYKRKNEAEAVRLRPHPVRIRAVLRHLGHRRQALLSGREIGRAGRKRRGARLPAFFYAMQGRIVQISVSPGGLPKRAVPEGMVTPLGIEGDRHAHPSIHGGPNKACCWFPWKTWKRWWRGGIPCSPEPWVRISPFRESISVSCAWVTDFGPAAPRSRSPNLEARAWPLTSTAPVSRKRSTITR